MIAIIDDPRTIRRRFSKSVGPPRLVLDGGEHDAVGRSRLLPHEHKSDGIDPMTLRSLPLHNHRPFRQYYSGATFCPAPMGSQHSLTPARLRAQKGGSSAP
ncbi:hypothetical protein ACVIKP_006440 [Rhizobium leguminosarum]